jgi:hypothetical protein
LRCRMLRRSESSGCLQYLGLVTEIWLLKNGIVSQCEAHPIYFLTSDWDRLQFMSAGLPATAVPTSIHCDHLIQAYEGAEIDLKVRAPYFDF